MSSAAALFFGASAFACRSPAFRYSPRLALNVFLGYTLLSIGSGMFFTPYEMTLVVIRAAGLVGLGVLVVPLSLALFIRHVVQRSNCNA